MKYRYIIRNKETGKFVVDAQRRYLPQYPGYFTVDVEYCDDYTKAKYYDTREEAERAYFLIDPPQPYSCVENHEIMTVKAITI